MDTRKIGRISLTLGAFVLTVTAALHAAGTGMIAGWTSGMDTEQQAALRLVWLTDSISWWVVAIAWLVAARKADWSWCAAALLLAAIPAFIAVGILLIDPTFFGGHLLLLSVALGTSGAWASRPTRA